MMMITSTAIAFMFFDVGHFLMQWRQNALLENIYSAIAQRRKIKFRTQNFLQFAEMDDFLFIAHHEYSFDLNV